VENAARFLNDEVVTDIVELNENMEKAFPGVTRFHHLLRASG
jgi:hypothetical protein